MLLLSLVFVAVFAIAIDAHGAVYWIESGGICRRDYGPDDKCIHYSNCSPDMYGGITKGHPEFCRFSGTHPILCCIESDKVENCEEEEEKKEYPPPSYGGYGSHIHPHETTKPPIHDDKKETTETYSLDRRQYEKPAQNNKDKEYPPPSYGGYGSHSHPHDTTKPPIHDDKKDYHYQAPSYGGHGNTNKPQTDDYGWFVPEYKKTTKRPSYGHPFVPEYHPPIDVPQKPSPPDYPPPIEEDCNEGKPITIKPPQPGYGVTSTPTRETTKLTMTERPATNPPAVTPQDLFTSAPDQDRAKPNETINQQIGSGIDDLIQQAQQSTVNTERPYYKPTFQNSTSLQKCGEYFRQVPLLKGKHTPIIGGRDARPKEFPHLAVLGYGEQNDIQWACGGTLISDQFVLTAAHCMALKSYGRVQHIRLGELDLSNTTEPSDVKDFQVTERFVHPLYKSRFNYHDIALLRMNAPVSFNSFIRPACLPTTLDLDESIMVTAGWGLTEEGGIPATVLQRVTLRHVSFDRCSRIYGSPRNLPRGIDTILQVCADGGRETRDACQGDSGGPLQLTNYDYASDDLLGFIEVVGITSFGKGCGRTAGVYTRVLPYVQWVERIVWPNN